MSRHDHAQVVVEIAGESYRMEPTLAALRKIEERFGSLIECHQALREMRFKARDLAVIVGAGSGADRKQLDDIEEQVFTEGMMNVLGPCVEFALGLLNPSGRPETDDPEPDEGKG